MRAALFILLLSLPASAGDPYGVIIEAMSRLGDDPAPALSVLRAQRPRLAERDRAIADKLASGIEHADGPAQMDAMMELLRRWSAWAPHDVIVQEKVIATIYTSNPDVPALRDEALRRARALAREQPGDVTAQRLLGSLLGAANQSPREALTALGHCLELDPHEQSCQAMFAEISRYYLSPRCDLGQLRNLELRAGSQVLRGSSFLEAADLPKVGVVVRLSEAGRVRLARATTAMAESGAQVMVMVDGQLRLRLTIVKALDQELVELPHVRLSELCRDVSTPSLPPSLQKWAD